MDAGVAARQRAAPQLAAGGASLLLHLLVLLFLIGVAAEKHGGRPAPRPGHSVVITLALQKPAPPSVPPAPPAPAPEPRPDVQGQPAPRPHRQAAPRPPAAATPQAANRAPPVPTEEQEIDDMVGRIHDNWLEPPGMARTFHCHVRIDYLAGGNIAAVTFLQGCGSPMLDDSLKRAIWKTQPLPLSKARQGPGSVEVEFEP